MLNKDVLLRRTNSGLDVFKHYVSGSWSVGRNFLKPLYEDSKASCNIYYDRRSQSYRMNSFPTKSKTKQRRKSISITFPPGEPFKCLIICRCG